MLGPIAEYETHKGTIAMYPLRTDIWREDAIHMQKYVCELVDIISKYETVFFFSDARHVDSLAKKYKKNQNVIVIPAEYDDIWARDIGPSFIKTRDGIKCVDWRFNAWGGRKEGSYFPWDKDDRFASIVAEYFGVESIRSTIAVEGGGILTDGLGTVFTTRSVLMNRNRNPFTLRSDVEEELKRLLCAKRIIWLKQGLAKDETNGHIDNVLSFINSRDVCLAWTEDKTNPNYKRVRDIESVIRELRNLKGEKYVIHHIPLPPFQYMTEKESKGLNKANSIDREAGDLLPASYLNFYIFNGAVLVPSFGSKTDEEALLCFKDIFEDREVIQVYSREPLLGGGGIHCILHEIPILE